jgi:hypothetical protein
MPNLLLLAPLPLATIALVAGLRALLRHMPLPDDALRRVPFWGAVGLFCLSFAGLAWSFFPYIVPERLDPVPGGERAGEPVDHPAGRPGRAAGHRGLHRAGLADLRRQGDGPALRLMPPHGMPTHFILKRRRQRSRPRPAPPAATP